MAPRARQQYAYFIAHLYISSDFVGLVDTDTLFITTVTPSSLFDIHGKPHISGIVKLVVRVVNSKYVFIT